MLQGSPPEEAPAALIEMALENGSTDNLTALCAWMAPVSVLEAPEIPEEEIVERQSLLVPLLAGSALVVVILVVIILLIFA